MVDTIFALSSGPPPAAVSIIRVSGPDVKNVISAFCRRQVRPRQAQLCDVVDPKSGDRIDSGIVLFFAAPHSFTGEDCLEFQVHGSRAVVAALLRALGDQPNLRPAVPGEFVRRAFECGKLPLTSIEGLADLIDARTEAQRKQALHQAGGKLAHRAEHWRSHLLDARSLLEAEIDFADEGEAPSGVIDEVRSICMGLVEEWAAALDDAGRAESIRSGYKIVIVGRPNAGKSSLLNALVRRDAAIVTEHSGTTRDVIEVELDLDGFPVVLCDTAGLRDSDDPVEVIGIERALATASSASLVIVLADSRGEAPVAEFGHARFLVVASKSDLTVGKPRWADLCISTISQNGCRPLLDALSARVAGELGGDVPLLTHERQRFHLKRASECLRSLLGDCKKPIEIVAEDLRNCSSILAEMTGVLSADDVLGAVFSRFCMGK